MSEKNEWFDAGPWSVGNNEQDGRVFVQSDDFKHDVRLYVDGDFSSRDERKGYAEQLASALNGAQPGVGSSSAPGDAQDETKNPPASLTDSEQVELLDWVSACQSAYHIASTPGHRFGGLSGALEENRAALVEFVDELIAARHTAPAAGDALDRDQQRLALWQAIRDITIGNLHDDKLILANLHKAGYVIALAAQVPQQGEA